MSAGRCSGQSMVGRWGCIARCEFHDRTHTSGRMCGHARHERRKGSRSMEITNASLASHTE